MEDRIEQELTLLRTRYADLQYVEEGRWVLIPAYPLPAKWNRTETDVAFQIKKGHPGDPPYGIYVPSGLLYESAPPKNYTEPAQTKPPFAGLWGILSWAPEKGQWRATADLATGSNLLNWVMGFSDRFKEGR
jgi:hypothetical protein